MSVFMLVAFCGPTPTALASKKISQEEESVPSSEGSAADASASTVPDTSSSDTESYVGGEAGADADADKDHATGTDSTQTDEPSKDVEDGEDDVSNEPAGNAGGSVGDTVSVALVETVSPTIRAAESTGTVSAESTVSAQADTPAGKGDCFVAENDEGRAVLYKVTDADARTVQVGSGGAGYASTVNSLDGETYSYATVDTAYAGTVTIPSTVSYAHVTYTVTSVASLAFSPYYDGFGTEYKFSLSHINLPSTVTEIGESAFYKANLSKGVSFPEGGNVKNIGTMAFYSTKLTSFLLPSTIESVGASAFASSSLSSITFPSSAPMTTIAQSTFADSNLASISIPSYITTINGYAFSNTQLTSAVIPATVSSLGTGVFSSCAQLKSASISAGSPLTEIPSSTFYGCSSLTGFTFPSFITSVESFAFSASGLNSVSIPSTLTYLGTGVFQGCTNLSQVSFASDHQLLNISERLFANCTALVSINLPDNLRSIGDSAFSGCVSLTNITIPSKVTSLGDFAFQSCRSMKAVVFQGDCTNLSTQTSTFYLATGVSSVVFQGKKSKNIVFISAMPTTYYTISFYTSAADVGVTTPKRFSIAANSIPNTATVSDVFSGTLYSLPDGSRWACEEGFGFTNEIVDSFYAYGEPQVADLAVGDTFTADTVEGVPVTYTVTSLASGDTPGTARVGSDAGTLTRTPAIDAGTAGSVTLSNQVVAPDAHTYDVTAISSYAFSGCSKYAQLTIPANITSIGAFAFYKDSMLRNVYFESDASQIVDANLFAACGNIRLVVFGGKKANISFGTSSPDIYYSVFYYDSQHDMQIGNKVATLVVHERACLGSLQSGEIRSGSIPDLKTGYEWAYEDGFGADIPLTDSCSVYANGIGFQTMVDIRGGNVAKAPCWFKILELDEDTGHGTVQVGLGKDGITAVYQGVSGTPVIPSTVTDADGNVYDVVSVGDHAFGSDYYVTACQLLKGIVLPDSSITSIGVGAFENCRAITSVTLPASLETLGASAFSGCTALASVDTTRAMRLTSISAYAFQRCAALASFTVPAGVTSLGDYAFYGCYSLDNYYEKGLKTITFAKGSQLSSIGNYAFAEDLLLEGNIVFPSTLQTIGDRAFSDCAIESLEFTGAISYIGAQAFYLNMDIASITFDVDVPGASFGSDCFHLWTYNQKGYVVGGKLSRVVFMGKKSSALEAAISCGNTSAADNDYGRQYRFYYNVKYYKNESSFRSGSVYTTRLTLEDDVISNNMPYLGAGTTWRAEDGFSIYTPVSDSFYVIGGKDISYAEVSGVDDSYYYTGSAITPDVTLTMPDGTVLEEGTDWVYDTSYGADGNGYTNNKRMGTAVIHLLGIGDYAGTRRTSFEIIGHYDVSDAFDASLTQDSFTYDGTPQQPTVSVNATVKGVSYDAQLGEDYEVSYVSNVDAGQGIAVVNGEGAFASQIELPFTISPMSISRCTISVNNGVYNAITQTVDLNMALVNPSGDVLVEGRDYSYEVLNVTAQGSGTLLVQGMGNYTGVLSRLFGRGAGTGGNGNGSGTSGNGSGGASGDGTSNTSSAADGGTGLVTSGSGAVGLSANADAAELQDENGSAPQDSAANTADENGLSGELGGFEGGSGGWLLHAIDVPIELVEDVADGSSTPWPILLLLLLLFLLAGFISNRIGFLRQLSGNDPPTPPAGWTPPSNGRCSYGSVKCQFEYFYKL